MQIGCRIYFDKTTGEVLVNTGERQGAVVEITTERDYQTYTILAERDPATVGCIQLEYGQYAEEFLHYQLHIDPLTEDFIWSPRINTFSND